MVQGIRRRPVLWLGAFFATLCFVGLGCKGELSRYSGGGGGGGAEEPVSAGSAASSPFGGSSSTGGGGFGPRAIASDGWIDMGALCSITARCVPHETKSSCMAYATANPPTKAETAELARCLGASSKCDKVIACLGITDAVKTGKDKELARPAKPARTRPAEAAKPTAAKPEPPPAPAAKAAPAAEWGAAPAAKAAPAAEWGAAPAAKAAPAPAAAPAAAKPAKRPRRRAAPSDDKGAATAW